jgi:hypothetical protein
MLMGMVSKLNDLGMGDLLGKIGLTSDVVQDMAEAVKDNTEKTVTTEATISPKDGSKTAQVKSVKVETIKKKSIAEKLKAEKEIVPHEEIKTGDTIDMEVKAKKKKK